MMKSHVIIFVLVLLASCTTSEYEKERVIVDSRMVSDSLQNVYDSLMNSSVNLPLLIDSAYFSIECIHQFEELARSTHGEFKIAIDPNQLTDRVLEVLEGNLKDNSDLLLIIDRTNSMRDDLQALINGLDHLIIELQKFKNVNIGIAQYGDKQNSFFPWYEFENFGNDYEGARNHIQKIEVHAGIDEPESVYDAILKTRDEQFWSSKGERIAILLGDAPSHDSTKSSSSIEDVLDYANSSQIRMNIYPIVLCPKPIEETKEKGSVMQEKSFIESVYPNPTTGLFSIRLASYDSLTIEIFDQNGTPVLIDELIGVHHRFNISDKKPGLYILRAYDKNKNYDVKKIIRK